MTKNFLFTIVLLFFFTICNISYANKFKIKDLEIELFDNNKLLKSSSYIREGFVKVDIKVFAEKNEDNIGSIILVMKAKVDKSGSAVRRFFLDYFFNFDNAIFNKEEAYHYVVDDKTTNAFQVKEFSLEKFIKRSDDFNEVRTALKKLYKKNSIKMNDRVIKSDHLYSKGNGDLVWVSYMFNYETLINENIFENGKSKFHPKNINEFKKYENYLKKWLNLALKRHDEFQNKLKINSKINLEHEGYDKNENLEFYKNSFYSSTIDDSNLDLEQKAKEEKAKKAAEQKAKEEKAKKAAEQKAKEEKAKKAAEQKAKEEKEIKTKEDRSETQDKLSVEELMSKIKELNEMYKSGLISKEEFEMLKSKLLEN